MKFFSKMFLRGLIAIAPLGLSLYFIFWFFKAVEGTLDAIVLQTFPKLYFPGLGVLTGVFIIFLVGIFLSSDAFLSIFEMLQLPFKNIPLIKSLYSSIEDLMSYFGKGDKSNNDGQQVVVVTLPNQIQVMGLMTRDDLSDLHSSNIKENQVAVFIPMSYGLGGYTIFVPRECVKSVDLKPEFLMKSALTAWMKKKA